MITKIVTTNNRKIYHGVCDICGENLCSSCGCCCNEYCEACCCPESE